MRIKHIPFHVSQQLYSSGNTVTKRKRKRKKKDKETNPFVLSKTLQFEYFLPCKSHTRENLLKISPCCHLLVFLYVTPLGALVLGLQVT